MEIPGRTERAGLPAKQIMPSEGIAILPKPCKCIARLAEP